MTVTTRTQAGDPPDNLYPSARRAWFACAVLTLASTLALMDRGILSLFVAPIQRDLDLSDTQVSLIVGFAFSIFYAIAGLPIGRLVDIGRRKTIAATGVMVWSIANGLCGLAAGFWPFFAARSIVGAGEAAVTPAAVSLLADYFPPARRGAAMGVFCSSLFFGTGVALLLGGALWRGIGDREVALPIIGTLHSWQLILILFASIGLIVAPLTLAIGEPRRLSAGAVAAAQGSTVAVREVARFYKANARALFGLNIGFSMQNYGVLAATAWMPTLLMRTQHWSLSQAGLVFGGVMLVMGPAGSIFGGVVADRLVARGRTDGRLIVAMIAALTVAAASFLIGIGAPGSVVVALAIFAFAGSVAYPLGTGSLQDIMPNAMRGQAAAIFVFLINLIAGGTSATAVALLTDYVFENPAALHWSFAIVATIGSLCAVACFASARAPFRRLVARLPKVEEGIANHPGTADMRLAGLG